MFGSMQLSSDLDENIFSFLTLDLASRRNSSQWRHALLDGISAMPEREQGYFQAESNFLDFSRGSSEILRKTAVVMTTQVLPGTLLLNFGWGNPGRGSSTKERISLLLGKGSPCLFKGSKETIFYTTLEKYTEIPQSPLRAHVQGPKDLSQRLPSWRVHQHFQQNRAWDRIFIHTLWGTVTSKAWQV